MSTQRVREAKQAFEDYRYARWLDSHQQTQPDLFSAPAWEDPKNPGERWLADALEIVRTAAERRESFTVEDLSFPSTPDARAVGAVMRSAARKGWIKNGGYVASGRERHGRPVVLWHSTLNREVA